MTISEKAGAMAKSGLAGGGVLGKKTQITLPTQPCRPLSPRETPSGGKATLRSVIGSRKRHWVSAPKNPSTPDSINLTLSPSWQGQVICT